MASSPARLTVRCHDAGTGPVATRLRAALPVVQDWLDRWSDLATSAVDRPVTVVLVTGAAEVTARDGEVVARVDADEVTDAEGARFAAMVAALDGAVRAARSYPRHPSIEVQVPSDDEPVPDPDEPEGFGPGEMAVFAHLGDDEPTRHDRFGDLDDALATSLRGVAALQDATVVREFGQWVIGRPELT
jgi:hypothetical protein